VHQVRFAYGKEYDKIPINYYYAKRLRHILGSLIKFHVAAIPKAKVHSPEDGDSVINSDMVVG
jgi:hypothetical protein